MKTLLTLSALIMALSLSACGDKHAHTYAVDAVEQAQANAIANAPKAEAIKFDDEHLPKMGSASTATADAGAENTATQANTATAQETQTATGEQKSDETATASADTASK